MKKFVLEIENETIDKLIENFEPDEGLKILCDGFREAVSDYISCYALERIASLIGGDNIDEENIRPS